MAPHTGSAMVEAVLRRTKAHRVREGAGFATRSKEGLRCPSKLYRRTTDALSSHPRSERGSE
eukprot:10596-Eustigmatos_ZCMA.PRE.1